MTSIATSILAAVRRLWSYFAPLRDRVKPLQVVADLCLRSRRELVVENATLRHQLSVLRRTSGRPRLGLTDKLRLPAPLCCLHGGRPSLSCNPRRFSNGIGPAFAYSGGTGPSPGIVLASAPTPST